MARLLPPRRCGPGRGRARPDRRIDELLAGWRQQLSGTTSRLPELALELFTENPFWSVGNLAKRAGVAFTTAQRAIDRIESAGIVALATEARRNRLYCAGAILEILEAPPQVTGTRTAAGTST